MSVATFISAGTRSADVDWTAFGLGRTAFGLGASVRPMVVLGSAPRT